MNHTYIYLLLIQVYASMNDAWFCHCRANPDGTIMPNDGRLLFKIIGLILAAVCILILTSVVIVITYGIDGRFQYHPWVGKPVGNENDQQLTLYWKFVMHTNVYHFILYWQIRPVPAPYPGWLIGVTIAIMVSGAISIPLVALCLPIFRRICPSKDQSDEMELEDQKASVDF